jgi:uncharacterized protein YgfB (UPF0149 family)
VTGIATDYGSLAELLNRSGSPLPLAELHGGLCGVICASGQSGAATWLDSLLDDCATGGAAAAELAARLEDLGNQTWDALRGFELEFAPLLPDDDSRIDQRAEALALWCHGFLAGLVIGGLDLVSDQTRLSDELSELVSDFAEISRAGAVPGESEEEEELDDSSFAELVEYVRVGAQFIFEELIPADTVTGAERTIH